MNNPSRVAFTLFGRDVYWYGVLMALGILIGVWLTLREGKRKKLTEDDILDMCLVIIPSGVVGARLYYVIFEWASYASNPIRALYIWEGGLAIYGAVIGGLLGMFIYSKVRKIRFLKLADCIAPGLVLAQAIGRWGNFFNQEAFGLPISNGELMWFPFAVYIEGYHTFNGQPCSNPYHMATFFYESVWCLIVFIILWSCRKKFRHDGDAILSYAALYGLERMLLVVAIAAFFLIRHFKEKKLGRLIWPAPEAESEKGTTEDEAGNAEDCKKEETSEAAEEKPEPEETDQGDSNEDGQ